MGNACECVCRQTSDDAADSLLGGYEGEMTGQPRGPPPPYQVHLSLSPDMMSIMVCVASLASHSLTPSVASPVGYWLSLWESGLPQD